MSDEQWLTSKEAQSYIDRTDRQLRRYAERGRVRTRTTAGRIQYNRADLDRLRSELPPDDRPKGPDTQIVPAGELASMVRELQRQITEAAAREGYLRAQLDTRPRLEDQQALREEMAEERATRIAAEQRLAELQRGRKVERRVIAFLAVVLVLVLLAFILFVALRT